MKNQRIKTIAMVGMLSAIAYISMVLIHLKIVPSAPFLTYDPKDSIITIGGFVFGPAYAIIISLIVACLEMLTVSDTGIIGMLMQVIATFSYAFVAALFYKNHRTKKTALIGMLIGTVCMSAVMLLWNYLLTPIYMGAPRSAIVPLLIPAILPFNICKGILNSTITMLIYKPLVNALRKSGLLPKRSD